MSQDLVDSIHFQSGQIARIDLTLVGFQDDDGVNYTFSPALQLLAAGKSMEDALAMMHSMVEEWVEIRKEDNDIDECLAQLGWYRTVVHQEASVSVKVPREIDSLDDPLRRMLRGRKDRLQEMPFQLSV